MTLTLLEKKKLNPYVFVISIPPYTYMGIIFSRFFFVLFSVGQLLACFYFSGNRKLSEMVAFCLPMNTKSFIRFAIRENYWNIVSKCFFFYFSVPETSHVFISDITGSKKPDKMAGFSV